MKPTVSPEVIAKLTTLVAQLSAADTENEVLRVAFLMHCELKSLVNNFPAKK